MTGRSRKLRKRGRTIAAGATTPEHSTALVAASGASLKVCVADDSVELLAGRKRIPSRGKLVHLRRGDELGDGGAGVKSPVVLNMRSDVRSPCVHSFLSPLVSTHSNHVRHVRARSDYRRSTERLHACRRCGRCPLPRTNTATCDDISRACCVCHLTVPASRNRDDHIKKKDEQWEHRRLDTEWQYLGRDSGLKVDIGRHKHLEEEARASEQQDAILPWCRPRPKPRKQEKKSGHDLANLAHQNRRVGQVALLNLDSEPSVDGGIHALQKSERQHQTSENDRQWRLRRTKWVASLFAHSSLLIAARTGRCLHRARFAAPPGRTRPFARRRRSRGPRCSRSAPRRSRSRGSLDRS